MSMMNNLVQLPFDEDEETFFEQGEALHLIEEVEYFEAVEEPHEQHGFFSRIGELLRVA